MSAVLLLDLHCFPGLSTPSALASSSSSYNNIQQRSPHKRRSGTHRDREKYHRGAQSTTELTATTALQCKHNLQPLSAACASPWRSSSAAWMQLVRSDSSYSHIGPITNSLTACPPRSRLHDKLNVQPSPVAASQSFVPLGLQKVLAQSLAVLRH